VVRESTYHIKSEQIRSNCIAEIQGNEPGGWTVEIRKAGKSNQMRNFFHALCDDIAKHTGYTKEQVKHMIKTKVLGFDVWKDRNGKEYQMVKSSEDCDKDEYNLLINAAYDIAVKMNIPIRPRSYYGVE